MIRTILQLKKMPPSLCGDDGTLIGWGSLNDDALVRFGVLGFDGALLHRGVLKSPGSLLQDGALVCDSQGRGR